MNFLKKHRDGPMHTYPSISSPFSIEQENVDCNCCKKDFASLDDRMQSFRDVYKTIIEIDTRILDEMAISGFYISPQSLDILCFYCGCRIHKWQNIAYPHHAHAVVNPNCPFLKGIKGCMFIFYVISSKTDFLNGAKCI